MHIATGVLLNGYRVYCDVILAAEGSFAIRLATRAESQPTGTERVWQPPYPRSYIEQADAEREAHRILGLVKRVSASGEPLYS